MIFRAGNFKAHDAMVLNEFVILNQENHPGGLVGTQKSYHDIMISSNHQIITFVVSENHENRFCSKRLDHTP